MQLTEVKDAKGDREFLEAAVAVHRGYNKDPNFIRPLDNDILNTFNPKKNKRFRHGRAIRWVLKDEEGKLLGRIAAFIDDKTKNSSQYIAGGCGFFECINNQEAANLLFDAAKRWNQANGMEAMDGPINFGERHQWWGLQISGFAPPTFQMNYNPPYYIGLFENYGFREYFQQYVYNYEVDKPVPEKFYDKARRIERNPEYSFRHFEMKKMEQYAEDIRSVYNEAWVRHQHHKGLTKEMALSMVKQMKPVMDEKIVWFGYYKEKPVAFFIMLPELNQAVKHLNGKLNWLGKLKFLYYLKIKHPDRMTGMLFGVTPEHQGKGLEGAIVIAAAKVVQPLHRYKNLEMNWIGDFNPKMISVVESLGTIKLKQYRTYRLLFDSSKPFFKHTIID